MSRPVSSRSFSCRVCVGGFSGLGAASRSRQRAIFSFRRRLASKPQQAVVSDPHEALRQRVEQEVADELVLTPLHGLLPIRVGGVTHSERDATVSDAEDPSVRDRDAMGVGAQVAEHALGSCERGLRVDDPVAAAKRMTEFRNGSVVAELPAFEGASETLIPSVPPVLPDAFVEKCRGSRAKVESVAAVARKSRS